MTDKRPIDPLAGDYVASDGHIVRGGSPVGEQWTPPLFRWSDPVEFVKFLLLIPAGS